MNTLPKTAWPVSAWVEFFSITDEEIDERASKIGADHMRVHESFYVLNKIKELFQEVVVSYITTGFVENSKQFELFCLTKVEFEKLLRLPLVEMLAFERIFGKTDYVSFKSEVRQLFEDWALFDSQTKIQKDMKNLVGEVETIDIVRSIQLYTDKGLIDGRGADELINCGERYVVAGFEVPLLKRPLSCRRESIEKAISLVSAEIAMQQFAASFLLDLSYIFVSVRVDNGLKLWGIYLARQDRLAFYKKMLAELNES